MTNYIDIPHEVFKLPKTTKVESPSFSTTCPTTITIVRNFWKRYTSSIQPVY